jgi:hypothetical protein
MRDVVSGPHFRRGHIRICGDFPILIEILTEAQVFRWLFNSF